ncbi:MAG: hypothetical protein M1819_004829 [Sarea resinae]|nr:MAG: hypothetical protein M1819_004829 [Sarea resinae]
MEVSNNISPFLSHPNTSNTFNSDSAPGPNMTETLDMDIDMDLDLGPTDDAGNFEYTIATDASTADPVPTPNGTSTSSVPSTQAHGITPHKIHIRGVDNLTTDDLNTFAAEHFSSDLPTRIEWIDDTSANLVYNTPATAMKALTSLSLIENEEPSSVPTAQLRPAKSFSAHPDSTLQVRLATIGDVKKPRAHLASRFYLMHPEYDPRERRKENSDRRERGRGNRYDEDGSADGDYRRRRYDDREHRRRRDEDADGGFDASLYDEGGAPATNTKNKELFPDRKARTDRRLRDRSASPARSDLMTLDDDLTSNRRVRRERSPPPRYHRRDPNPHPKTNTGKELFAPKDGDRAREGPKELFPNRTTLAGPSKELFPNRMIVSNHRRTDAFDAADETSELFSTSMQVPFVDGSTDSRKKSVSLADRVSGPLSSSPGPLEGRISSKDDLILGQEKEEAGFSIRGAAEQGFSIRGAANGGTKELFPGKLGGNAGKELFAEKLEGRGGRRRKAEDMFY